MRVGIIGTGKVAHQLAYAINKLEDKELTFVMGRKASKAKKIIESTSCVFIDNVDDLPETDVLIIAIKDDVIQEVSEGIPHSATLVVHTSGIKDTSVLDKHDNRGILYPLYSFFNKDEMSMEGVPFLIESNHSKQEEMLYDLALQLSGKAYRVTKEEKEQLHLAAVFANNFTNHMMTRAFDLLDVKSVNKEILLPIIKQSCLNWIQGNAKENQSGPALRNDKETMKQHLGNLDDEQTKNLYTIISDSILKYYT